MEKRIEYTPTDGPLAGRKLTGGTPGEHQGIAVVFFEPLRHGGKLIRPTVKIEGRPDLAAKVASYKEDIARESARLAWRPNGYQELSAAWDKLLTAEERNRTYLDRVDGVYVSTQKQQDAVTRLTEQYPAAALWIRAEGQRDTASWSDPTGKVEAAKNCMDVLRDGGSLEDAEKALAERRETDPWR